MSTIEQVRGAMLTALEDWKADPRGSFDWFDDRCCQQPWHYWVHCRWVSDWNAEDRVTAVEPFIRQWLTDENITKALEDGESDE